MTVLKSQSDIRMLKEAGRVAGEVCELLIAQCAPGVTTVQLEQQANQLLSMRRSTAPFKLFEGFNHAICTSINDEVVNGWPSRERAINEGDVVSIAIGSCVKGFYGKAARTVYIGKNPSDDIERLLNGTQACVERLVEQSAQFQSLNKLLAMIPEIATEHGLTVVENSGGCGIGKQLHDSPPTYNNPADMTEEVPLIPGMAFTIMPMLSLGTSPKWKLHEEDHWTQITEDGGWAAHFADSVLMTDQGLIYLTRP